MLFDGEEAFVQWTSTDSIYGSRHLAAEMEKQGGLFSVGDKTGLQAIVSHTQRVKNKIITHVTKIIFHGSLEI